MKSILEFLVKQHIKQSTTGIHCTLDDYNAGDNVIVLNIEKKSKFKHLLLFICRLIKIDDMDNDPNTKQFNFKVLANNDQTSMNGLNVGLCVSLNKNAYASNSTDLSDTYVISQKDSKEILTAMYNIHRTNLGNDNIAWKNLPDSQHYLFDEVIYPSDFRPMLPDKKYYLKYFE